MNLREQFEKETDRKALIPGDYGVSSLKYYPPYVEWLEAKLTKKDAEIEALRRAMRNKEQTASTMWHNQQIELQSLRSKMDKAQRVWVFYNSCGELVYDMTTPFEENKDKVLRHWNWTAKQVLLMEVEESNE